MHGGSEVFEVDVLDGTETRRQQSTHHQDEERGQELIIRDKNIFEKCKKYLHLFRRQGLGGALLLLLGVAGPRQPEPAQPLQVTWKVTALVLAN